MRSKQTELSTEQTECRRCGTCCNNGGPALHFEDAELVGNGILMRKRLITIRKGELVVKPHDRTPQTAQCELVKISGTGKTWQCYYYDGTTGCMIYGDRPLACSELQCWNTTAIEELVEKNTLSRFDIIGEDEPIYALVKKHETDCPCPNMEELQRAIAGKEYPDIESLESLINEDIRVRTTAVQQYDITLAEELFYFGRPLFQLLQQIGVRVFEKEGVLRLRWPV